MSSISFGRFDNADSNPVAVTGVGTTQVIGTTPVLTGAINVLTTSVGQTAVLLPSKHPVGSPLVIRVTSATAALVFPQTGGSINGGSANASFSVAQNKPVVGFCHPNGIDWTLVLSA